MCEHSNLKAVVFNYNMKEKEDSKDTLVIHNENINPWACTVSGVNSEYNYLMGRIFKCKDCGEKFVIQNMFRLDTK